MRLTLIDLLVLLGLFVVGLVAGIALIHFLGYPALAPLELAMGVGAVVVFESPIYRRFQFRPLFLPRCPHCHKRPELYGIAGGGWPREVVVCGACRGVCHLWYDKDVPADEVSADVPSLTLRWPYFIGLWHPLSGGRA